MKKLWLIMLAVVLAFGLVFGITGCRDLPETGGDAEELVIDDAAKIGAMLTAEGYYGAASGVEAEGNKASFDLSEGHDNYGFKLDFAEYVESGHTSLEITFKLAEATTLTGGLAKIGFKAAVGADVTPYATHEIIFGGVDAKGVEKTQKFSLQSPNKLPNKYVLFNHNKYGDDASNQGATGAVKYTLEITKLKFLATEPVPCCEDDCCDKTTCKDCLADACEGKCGTVCCINFNGDATTKVDFIKGATPAVDKVIHTNPPVVAAEGGAVMAANGTVTMNNYSLIYYKFPTAGKDADGKDVTIDYTDYDYIDIYYTLSNVVNSATVLAYPDSAYDAASKVGSANRNKNLKVEMRDYKGADAYTQDGGSYKDFGGIGTAGDHGTVGLHRIQTWGDNGTGGFAIRVNSWDVNPAQGSGGCAEFIDIKITKIEFSKGTRYKVEFFSPMTPANNNFPTLEVLSGNGLAKRYPTVSNPGWNFLGWVDAWDGANNKPAASANEYDAGTAITKNTTLFANWSFVPPPTDLKITVAGASVISPVTKFNGSFTIMPLGNGIRYTQKEGNGWDYPVFEINFAGSDSLSDFATITYKIKGVDGDSGYKGVKGIKASATAITTGEVAGSNFIDVTGGLGWSAAGIAEKGAAAQSHTLTIDSTAVATFTEGRVFIAFALDAPGGAVYEISDITLTK